MRANDSVHGFAGAPLTVMPFGSQIVSRRGVMTDIDGAPLNGEPVSVSAPLRPVRRRLAPDVAIEVAVFGATGSLDGGGGGVKQPSIRPETVGQGSVRSGNPSPSESVSGQPLTVPRSDGH